MARPLIVIGTPCFGGLVTHDYMMSVLRLTAQAPSHGIDVAVITLGHDALITRSRSSIMARFLENAATTHLLFIDADICFQPDQVLRMLRFDKDFVAGIYPAKVIDWQRVTERFGRTGETLEEAGLAYVGEVCGDDTLRTEQGFATAQYAGTGFQLIKRRVFERMIAAYPETKYKSIHVFPRAEQPSEHLYALFDCIIDPDTGAYLSEDYSFCRRWRQIGGEIWLDLHSKLTHVGQHDFKGNVAARFARVTPPTESAQRKEAPAPSA